ncbi:MAG: phosphoribosylformylglycinamidine cyclo-ligase, partial [Candidatus Diapherotrites archaeon]|nr:phosphoribosylformylglycinamidine cyclo-ligase [Candidatus Diapherotrites archaeon]
MVSYKSAGVDVSAAQNAKKRIMPLVLSTQRSLNAQPIGGFGGVIDASFLKKFSHPVVVSSMDGVGTKAKIGVAAGRLRGLGEDIVNHGVNDILCMGATPWFFLDYFACSSLNANQLVDVVSGMSKACRENGLAIVGGETAIMPGVYSPGEIDVAGCIVGVAEKKDLLPQKTVRSGDALIGLASNGLHTNGYSLARKVLLKKKPANPHTLDLLLKPHTSYLKPFKSARKHFSIKAIAHITGGGFYENIPRVLPEGLSARIDKSSFPVLPVFRLIAKKGNVSEKEMFGVFNMGIGMIWVVGVREADSLLRFLQKEGQRAYRIGEIVKGH